MELIKSKDCSINYLAKIVDIKSFTPHPNPEVNRLKCAIVDGYTIQVGIDYEPGLYVYFPALSKINPNLLSYGNLFRHSDLNADTTKEGLFDDNCRVRVIKLKGCLSEGFLLPATVLDNYILSVTNKHIENLFDGLEFDSVKDGDKEFWINKKFVIQSQNSVSRIKGPRAKVPKGLNRIRDDQFRFHYVTEIIKKVPHVIKPNSLISLTYKIHGTSGISARVLCHKNLNWKQKIAKFLTGETFDDYDYIYASRTVIKNKYFNPNAKEGYYDCDVWKYADDVVRPHLQRGETVYYEIVGYLPDGKFIQKNYDYKCIKPNSENNYCSEVNFKVRIYRVTITNPDGIVHELSAREVQQWCDRNGLIPVEQCYYGYAKDLYPEIANDEDFSMKFIDKLANDKKFYMERNSPHCNNKVPHEGLVIKIENGLSSAFKLKCFAFLNKEQVELETNIEDEN